MTSGAASDEAAQPAVPVDGLPPAQRRRAMACVLTAIGLASLDTAIANTALPTIAADLHVSPGASVWIVNIYQFAIVASLLPLAALGESIGQRRIQIGGIVVFTVASLGCALSGSLSGLVAARAVQGLGAAALMGSNLAIIRSIYPSRELGRGVGFNALVVGIGFAVGPTIASAILLVASWPWLFAVNIPVGVVAIALARTALPETHRSGHRFDVLAALLTACTLTCLVAGLGEATHGAHLWLYLLLWAGAFGFGAILLRRQAGDPAPIFAADLLQRPVFALTVATSICSFATQGLAFVALPFLFQHTFGRTQVETGFLMTPWPVVVAVMAPIAGRMSDRYNPGLLGGIGLAILSVGMFLILTLPAVPDTGTILWRMALCGIGFGFFQAPNLRAFLTASPPSRSGGASGMVALSRLLGQSSGAALVATCFALTGDRGPLVAVGLGGLFSGAASLASFLRLAVRTAPSN